MQPAAHIRDESFITRWGGGRLYSGGVGNFFGDVRGGGVENKKPLGQGWWSYISSGIWGSDVFHSFLLSLKVIASGGLCPQETPPPPPYPNLYCQQYEIFRDKMAAKIRKCINVYPIIVKNGILPFHCALSIIMSYSIQIYTRQKKKRIQYSLQNYNQLRIVDNIVIFERNLLHFLSVTDKYPGLQYCMKNLFFFDCMYRL